MSSSSAQSYLQFPLTKLLGNSGNVRVLRALMSYGAPLSAVQLARDTGLTRQGVRLVLEGLEGQGLVTTLGLPRSQLFAIVPVHPFASTLTTIFEQERNRWDVLNQTLRDTLNANQGVRSAWLYGSVARGEDTPRSDIDIAIVTQEDGAHVAEEIRDAFQGLEDLLHAHFSLVALTPDDVARLSSDDPWWKELIKDAKLLKGGSPQQEALRCTRGAQLA
ncbi:MAG TPA: nucleotidyltransferase domain-containing protein [Polaromonas sp.]|uniref:nucleotidyltransferase domain-containing protein n=1 Tax=Polaromonas sp. UBA4122 TaxID=1947074 RepID=UPI000EE48419|nr:nucleotidyltransferase domain-containing protein [Polaromonas sp. UBA4122]HAL39419.1 nucleotidyltransferase domain-containing protein [Polaromonas sp.]